jgi:hypothetical protein
MRSAFEQFDKYERSMTYMKEEFTKMYESIVTQQSQVEACIKQGYTHKKDTTNIIHDFNDRI